MQRLEVVTGHSEFPSHFSIPQAHPTQPVPHKPARDNFCCDNEFHERAEATPELWSSAP